MQLSWVYFAFLCVALPLYFIVPRRHQSATLLTASLVFYSFAGWYALATLALIALLTYVGGRCIGGVLDRCRRTLDAHREDGSWEKEARRAYRDRMRRRARMLLALFVGIDICCLLFFKLSLPDLVFGGRLSWSAPMGLSFVVLSAIGYLADVAAEQTKPETSPARFALFIFYFPQMWQGPINRYSELAPALTAPHAFCAQRAICGLLRVVWGLVKRVVIADTAAVAVSAILSKQQQMGGGGMWLLVLLYSVQIYGDFTGGIDISLGVSHLLGIALPENFDRPFAATSLKDYWRRWHMTMGGWFERYVFYPLSVSRVSQALSRLARRVLGERIGRQLPLVLAVLLTWCATGLWHGVAWNFLLWGLFNGLFLLLSQWLSPVRRSLADRLPRVADSRALQALCCVGTVFTAGLLRTLDLNADPRVTLTLWGQMLAPRAVLSLGSGELWGALGLDAPRWVLLALGVALMAWVGRMTPRTGSAQPTLRERILGRPVLCAILLSMGLCAILVLGNYGLGYDAAGFIYGEF